MIKRLVLVVLIASSVIAGQHALAGSGSHVTARPVLTPVAPEGVGETDHLTPRLHRAINRAIAAAAADGVELRVTSGWRSPERQEQLYEAAIRKYGSPRAASQWVLPPGRSAHVLGQAVDVGPKSGATWLEKHGVHYGLCRRYDNEYWHFELLAVAKGSVCPAREPHA
jgi:LAS superfamily LD-carboxypeptidase LdcB